ncbi:hypothetical protein ONZ51_g4778 [Trametes cubensis]|uniref:RlpA-like protein double-psi beta-barrel domain-containing protein n=1 Tax=Trametes cubensis TaxID=1111947 RepID=A0AAD7XBP9_9APHY|nr:hypothetical protein ONZ51_g4778 [Trametes cubensis]
MKATFNLMGLGSLVATLFLAMSLLPLTCTGVTAAEIGASRMALERKYGTPHSLGKDYVFDPRDGWETVNTTNLLYKYSTPAHSDLEPDDDSYDSSASSSLQPRAKKSTTKKTSSKTAAKKTSVKSTSKKLASSAGSVLSGGLTKIISSIKGIGKPEPVTITWYTGHDLLNPSCWDNPNWHPTDASFAAALTLSGWTTKPKCFKFLELCHTSQKCVFVRVVDSCAGCAHGSKHVDLTKAAFSALADLNQGLLTVQMRQATEPKEGWVENYWGPK